LHKRCFVLARRTEYGRHSFGCQDLAADRLESVPLGSWEVRHQALKPIGDFGVEVLRDALHNFAAFVVDDLASTNPWTPRGMTVRGRAEIRAEGGERMGQGFDSTLIVITPASIISWGIDGPAFGPPNSRKIS
jgi:hypothetical protein